LIGICKGIQDPTLTLADQARWTAVSQLRIGDIVPSSFMRVREVVLEWSPPRSDAVGARQLALRLIGQNLLTWTRYDGIDPEVGGTSPNPGEAPFELFQSPLPRRVRLELRMGVM
jgi:hypothetical protein